MKKKFKNKLHSKKIGILGYMGLFVMIINSHNLIPFLTKNFNRLYKGGGTPNTIILYQYVDSTVKYTKENGFIVNIYAYMDRIRYTSKKKYSPKISDCNAVRNKIFLNKVGYNFLTQKKNNFVNESDLTEVISNNILNLSGISIKDKEKLINQKNVLSKDEYEKKLVNKIDITMITVCVIFKLILIHSC